MAKLNARETQLAKRVGKGGEAFVLARRKRPGLSLLEFQALSDDQLAELVDGTAPESPVPPAPVPDQPPTTTTTAAKKTAAKKATGTTGRR